MVCKRGDWCFILYFTRINSTNSPYMDRYWEDCLFIGQFALQPVSLGDKCDDVFLFFSSLYFGARKVLQQDLAGG